MLARENAHWRFGTEFAGNQLDLMSPAEASPVEPLWSSTALSTVKTRLKWFAGSFLFLSFLFSTAMVWSAALWPDTAAESAIYLTGAVVAAFAIFGRISLRYSRVLIPFVGLPLWGLLQLLFGVSEYRFATLQAVIAFGSVALALVLGTFALEPARNRSAFHIAISIFGACLSAFALLQFIFGHNRIYFFLTPPWPVHAMGPFVNRDHYAALVELLLPVPVWLTLQNPRRRVFYLAVPAAGLMYASIVACASRAGVVIATIELAVVTILALLQHRRAQVRFPLRAVLLLAFVVLALSAAVGWKVVFGRFGDRDPLAYRRDFWAASGRMIKDKPLTGFGLGSWRWVYPRYAAVDPGALVRYAHNDWLEWACDGGVVFFAAFLAIWIYSLRLGRLHPWALGPAMVFAHSFVDFPLQIYPILLGLVLILAAAESSRVTENTRNPSLVS